MLNIQAKSSRGSWYFDLILLTVGIALVFGLFLGARPLSVPDEARYAEIPREMLVQNDFVTPHLNGVKYFEKPPLFYWLQASSIKLLNPIIHRLFLKMPSVEFTSSGIPFYMAGKSKASAPAFEGGSAMLPSKIAIAQSKHTKSQTVSSRAMNIEAENLWNKTKRIESFGAISEWTVRLPNALVALLGCLLVYAAGRILFERRTGVLSAIILASSLLYFALARMVTLDMTLSICLSGSLLAFLVSVNNPVSLRRRFLLYSAYIFAGLAVLTKGLIGIVFPVMIIGLWILLTNQWRLLKQLYLPSGILIFLAVVLPWHILVQLKNPEFFHFYFIEQQFLRYSTLIAQRYQPDWFFIPIFIAGFLPWICFLVQAIVSHFPRNWQEFREKNNYIFLLLWVGLIFGFFSFSHSKLIPYILPIFPALALLTGHYFSTHWQRGNLKWGYIVLPLVWLSLGVISILWWSNEPSNSLPQAARPLLFLGYVVFLLNSLIAGFLAIRNKSNIAFGLLAAGSVVSFILFAIDIPQLDMRSIKPLVTTLKPLLHPGDKIVAYSDYYQDLPFYLNQRVVTVNVGGELSFGMQHQDTQSWMLKNANFWPIWNSHEHVYMVTSKKIYQQLKHSKNYVIYLLEQTKQDVLLSNHPIHSATND